MPEIKYATLYRDNEVIGAMSFSSTDLILRLPGRPLRFAVKADIYPTLQGLNRDDGLWLFDMAWRLMAKRVVGGELQVLALPSWEALTATVDPDREGPWDVLYTQ